MKAQVSKNNYLLVKISGVYNRKNFFPELHEIGKECAQKSIRRTLIDITEADFTGATLMDRFALGEKLSEIFGPKIKAAFAANKKFITGFAETVAVNRGANVAVFPDLESAEKWLTGN